jgi:hypothetical protein
MVETEQNHEHRIEDFNSLALTRENSAVKSRARRFQGSGDRSSGRESQLILRGLVSSSAENRG